MKKIKKYADWISDELDSAKCYAEKYVEFKAMEDGQFAGRFRNMAEQELDHASTIHELAVHDIEKLSTVFKAPQYMQESWEKSHAEYVEKTAWIRQMLAM